MFKSFKTYNLYFVFLFFFLLRRELYFKYFMIKRVENKHCQQLFFLNFVLVFFITFYFVSFSFCFLFQPSSWIHWIEKTKILFFIILLVTKMISINVCFFNVNENRKKEEFSTLWFLFFLDRRTRTFFLQQQIVKQSIIRIEIFNFIILLY